ncbi:DUF736 domain-containing protein [Phyllobacterium sp. SB3]|uniref:DUF736 domain-containing protein n=1 Tax=Phyllobacterium sp. SB3 TaxID=3156073 RepID=UPI0032AF1CB1
MAHLGLFNRTQSGYSGHLRAPGLNEEITLVQTDPSDSGNAPEYRVLLGDEDGLDIGAAWKHVGERAGDYLSLEIESPLFPQPLRANLFRSTNDGSVWGLHTAPKPKRQKGD